jgi:hypothetical protein
MEFLRTTTGFEGKTHFGGADHCEGNRIGLLARDQEVGGSNPLAPTTLILPSLILTHLRCNRVRLNL